MAGGDPRLVPDVSRIAVLRANGIGDFVFALPALSALRAAYPDAEVVLLGLPWHVAFLEGRPGPVDRVWAVPPYPGIRGEAGGDAAAARDTFFRHARDRGFDLALQLHGGGRNSNGFVRRLGARLTAGCATPDAPPLDRVLHFDYHQSEQVRLVETVALVGATDAPLEPRLAITDRDRREAAAVYPAGDDRPVVALNPGAGDPRRRWPPDRFAAVADRLAATGARVVLTGAAQDAPLTAAVAAAADTSVDDLAGRLSVGGLAALLARCAVVVSNDSGPLHLARAVGTPTTGIFWCANVINGGPLTRARDRVAISWRTQCASCGADLTDYLAPRCPHDDSIVDAVTVDEVAAHALDLLAGAGAP